MPIQFFMKKDIPIPEFEEVWVQRFTGDEGWGCWANCSFSGGVFNIAGPGMFIVPSGSSTEGWKLNYRPEKIRVTYYADDSVDLALEVDGGPNIFSESGLPSGTQTLEFDLSWTTYDIYRLYFMVAGAGYISNIEFLEKIPTGNLLYFDDTYWENYGQAWQAQFVDGEWVSGSGSYNIELRPIGSWAVGFKPTNMRIYFDGDWSAKSGNILLRTAQSGGQNIASVPIGSYISGTNIPLSTKRANIGNLIIPTGTDTDSITGIEFDFK